MSYWNALIVQRAHVLQRLRPPCGIENGLCEKSTFFSSSFHSNIGKSTIQANSNRASSTSLRSCADLGAREAGEFGELVRIAGDEERRVARLQAERRADRLDALRADVVGERAAPADARRLRGRRRGVVSSLARSKNRI